MVQQELLGLLMNIKLKELLSKFVATMAAGTVR
jgi:hypothetical protein